MKWSFTDIDGILKLMQKVKTENKYIILKNDTEKKTFLDLLIRLTSAKPENLGFIYIIVLHMTLIIHDCCAPTYLAFLYVTINILQYVSWSKT